MIIYLLDDTRVILNDDDFQKIERRINSGKLRNVAITPYHACHLSSIVVTRWKLEIEMGLHQMMNDRLIDPANVSFLPSDLPALPEMPSC